MALQGKNIPNVCHFFGSKDTVKKEYKIFTDAKKLSEVGTSQVSDYQISDRVRVFSQKVFGINLPEEIAVSDAQEWLYDNLPDYEAFIKLYELCRDGAKSYTILKNEFLVIALMLMMHLMRY